MASPLEYEVPGDTDHSLLMNYRKDWDDLIPMERTPGVFNASSTLWHPVGDATFPFGFFNPIYFTNGLDKQE